MLTVRLVLGASDEPQRRCFSFWRHYAFRRATGGGLSF